MIEASDHDHAVRLVEKARLLATTGRFSQAIKMCEASIAADPMFSAPWALKAAVELDLYNVRRYQAQANQYLRRASESARQAVRLEPESYRAHGLFAKVAGMLGETDLSITAARESVRLGPEVAWSHRVLSEVSRKAGRFDDALTAATQAVDLNPLDPLCHIAVSQAHIPQRQWHEAETALRAALRLRADDAQALNTLAAVVKSQGRLEEAMQILENAARLNPSAARHNIVLNSRGEGRQYLSSASKTISDSSERRNGRDHGQPHPWDWVERARPHIRTDPDLAAGIIDELRDVHPTYDKIIAIGDALLSTGRGEGQEARRILGSLLSDWPYLREQLLLDPDLGPLLFRRAGNHRP